MNIPGAMPQFNIPPQLVFVTIHNIMISFTVDGIGLERNILIFEPSHNFGKMFTSLVQLACS
jgi:hypothetical protein